ncbi:MAG: PIG-L family deacetylase, partial [Gemmatimonadaceae bacterium]
MSRAFAVALIALASLAPSLGAQEHGASALVNAVKLLGADTPRVLYVAAHPDDEDPRLIAYLSRGGRAEVAYLSLTRGEGGANLIGDELGDALGVLRTQELLAGRRIDGARQYFTRAYDFGFSKSAAEAYTHWPRDSLLNDVIRVVRAFRPHVIVATFSGTPRDNHGQHQVSGRLARDAYDLADDVARFPIAQFGAPWTPL